MKLSSSIFTTAFDHSYKFRPRASTISGMRTAAPIFAEPTNHVLSDLPFAHSHVGPLCHDVIRQTFNTPSDESVSSGQRVLLHLRTLNGPVLLEMEASTLSLEAERFVVLTGLEVNADLAGLIATSREDEAASTIISELTESSLGDAVPLLDDVFHHPITATLGPAAAVVVPLADREVTGMVDPTTRSPRRRNYAQSDGRSSMTPEVAVGPAAVVVVPPAERDITRVVDPTTRSPRRHNYAQSDGSSSIMTPGYPDMPVARRGDRDLQHLIANIVVQRAWRRHRPGICYPRSLELASMVMRAGTNGDYERVWHLIALFVSGIPTPGSRSRQR